MVSEAVGLLKELITIPSISREEAKAADKLEAFMIEKGLTTHREGNNIWSMHEPFDNNKPTLLLNAHIDTVKPASSWQHPLKTSKTPAAAYWYLSYRHH